MDILKILMNGCGLVLNYMKKTRDAIGFGSNGNPTRPLKNLAGAGMIKDCSNNCSNNLSRYYKLLLFLVLCLSACGPAATPMPTTEPTGTATATPIPTATATPIPKPTSLPTFTPQAAWYLQIDPALGVLKYQYANVLNARAKVYASFQDAVGKTGNYGHLPNFPAYVAYTKTETRDGSTYYFDPVNYGWINGDDLQLLSPSGFSGLQLTRDVTFRFGWVLAGTQSVNAAGAAVQTYKRYQVVHEVPAAVQKPAYIAIGADEWLPESAVALVNPAVPAEAGPDTCRRGPDRAGISKEGCAPAQDG